MNGTAESFIHLFVHSYYSFFDSTMSPEDIVRYARDTGASAVAQTDTNNLTGAVVFYKLAKNAGIKPIIGAEVTARLPGEDFWKRQRIGRKLSDAESEDSCQNLCESSSPSLCKGDFSARIILLARNFTGYSEISHLLTRRMLAPSFDLPAEVRKLTTNVITLSDSLDLLKVAAEHTTANLYAMLLPSRRRRSINRIVYELARAYGIPLVVACDAKIASPADAPLHTLLHAMRRLKTTCRITPDERIDPAQHLQTEEEIRMFFGLGGSTPASAFQKDLHEAVQNSARIAEDCNCELPLGEWKFPRSTTHHPEQILRKLVERGILERYGTPLREEVIERMNYELSIIAKLEFPGYFLLVNRIVQEARSRGFFTVGRGSAANSIVSYALHFTDVCPLRYNLYFERFLNPERNVPPDIDIDFSWRERDDIIEWCFEYFGTDKVALIATISTLQTRQAIREVAKAYGIAESEVNAFTSLRETGFQEEVGGATGRGSTRTRRLSDEEPWRTILMQAERISGYPHHLSIHCGGIIIAPGDVRDFIPLTISAKGFVITQMDMFSVEDMGLIKIDLLSNRSLGVLKEALDMIEGNQRSTQAIRY